MHKHMEKKLELLEELTSFLEENKIKYYIEGDILINIYNNIEINNNINFNIAICDQELENIEDLNNESRAISMQSNDNKTIYYYQNTDTLYYDLCDKNGSKYIYLTIKTNCEDYKKYKKVNIDNISVVVPNNLDLYLENTYGLGYKYLKEKVFNIPSNIIYSPLVSYDEYISELDKNKIRIKRKTLEKAYIKTNKERKLNKITQNYRNMVQRTHSRFKLLELYEDKKDIIIKLSKEKKYNELKDLLNEYLYEIKRYYDLNMGLCFDKDIFDITIEYLKHDNQKQLADFLIKNTPSKHLCNIDFSYKDKGKTERGQLKDLQESFEKLLKEFDDLCKKNNIIYFVDSGSVLGAIRHNGFIPWDDDVDVVMTYDNWKKLLKVMEKEPINNTKFVCIENNPNHTLYTGKLFNTLSTKVYYSYSLLDSTYGYHLDIMILDEYIDNKYLRKLRNGIFYLYGQILNPNELRFNKNISFLVYISNVIMKLIGRKQYLAFLRKIIFKNKNHNSKYYSYRWQKQMKFEKNVFEKQLYVPFGNINVPIPTKYVEYLETSYGESWFVIPLPKDRQPSKRVFNLYVPYNLYQDDYMSFIDKDLVNKSYRKLKMIKMKRCNSVKKSNKERELMKYYRDVLEINKTIDINKVKEYYNNNEYGKTKEYLSAYYSLQSKKMYLNDGMLFFEDKEFLYEVVYTLIMCGEFYNARKLIKSPKIKEILKESYDKLNKLMDDAKNISKKSDKDKRKLFKEHPYCISFYLEYYSLIKTNDEKKNEIDKFNKVYPNYGEVMYIEALYNLEMNNVKTAIELFNTAKENTRNGLIIKRINEILNDLNK